MGLHSRLVHNPASLEALRLGPASMLELINESRPNINADWLVGKRTWMEFQEALTCAVAMIDSVCGGVQGISQIGGYQ